MAQRLSLFSRFTNRLFGGEIARRVLLAVRALDDLHDRAVGKSESDRDRRAYKREEILEMALTAWRENPLAKRIVGLTSDYVVGGSIGIESDHAGTNKFLHAWRNNRLNHLDVRWFDWCDELTRSGELFPVLSTDAAGMSYLRAIPAAEITEIVTAKNDVEQELEYWSGPESDSERRHWMGYNAVLDTRDESGAFKTVMLHYAINRPVGALRGESDLAPLLKWLTRYSAWLEDRIRLNRFRQAFLFWVRKAFRDEGERMARQNELNANPPVPGSILVTSDEETWDVLHPKLDSFEASQDGMGVKKMIAAGASIPMHYLAEPESSTRSTAEQAGGPTFRHYDRRQLFFVWMVRDLARIVVTRRAQVDRKVKADAEVIVSGQDISVRDNSMLATAATAIVNSFILLRDRGLIDDHELVRMCYKFAGEVVDVQQLLEKAKRVLVNKDMVGIGMNPIARGEK